MDRAGIRSLGSTGRAGPGLAGSRTGLLEDEAAAAGRILGVDVAPLAVGDERLLLRPLHGDTVIISYVYYVI